MAEKFNIDDNLTPQELAKHLRKPDGKTGRQVGLQMNKGNKYICLNSYKTLAPKGGSHILEIGMGNGFYVKDLLRLAENLYYTGVDFSSIMVQEAKLINKKFIDNGTVQFKQASIEKLPFPNDHFNCITTTNTIYFWPHLENNVKELLRVLKPNGKLLIAYRAKNFMDKIELSKYGFEKYDLQTVEGLLSEFGFKEVFTEVIKEPELEFDGKAFEMEGLFTYGIKSV